MFQVLVPRFADYTTAYTRQFKVRAQFDPASNVPFQQERVVVELRGHPFPPLAYSNTRANRNHIHNVLLSEAKRDLRAAQVERLIEESQQEEDS